MARAKQERHVVAANDKTERSLSEMSRTLSGHTLDTALRAGHGHAVGSVAGNAAPDNDHALQKNQFIPQRVFADQGQVSGGSFQSGASGADYETTNEGAVADSDSGNPTGY